ncbi:hypothetical protein HDU86_000973 [Geranomyces michiganensis]|nr:hypothetical protein HDU86_000973 [Geranomyces michiganensis]
MQFAISAFAALALAAASPALAWGAEGHSSVGFVADALLKNETAAVVDYLLQGKNLNISATWADEIKSGTQGDYKWASALHYIDAEEQVFPPDTNGTIPLKCDVELPRDSNGGINIVDAIGNFTTISSNAQKYPYNLRSDALKFLSHFFGDITQPLHTCGKLVGGNNFFARWDGAETYVYNGRVQKYQLHVLWDVYMPQRDINLNFGGSLDKYHEWILASVQPGGMWHDEAPSWFRSDAGAALAFANDANDLNCATVWDTKLIGTNATSTTNDLSKEYYEANYMLIRKALAKGGYRLGKYLDVILAGQPTHEGGPSSTSTSSAASASSTIASASSSSAASQSTPVTTTTTPPVVPPVDTGAVTSTQVVIVTPTDCPETTTAPTKPTKPTYNPGPTDEPIVSGAAHNSVAAGLAAAAAAAGLVFLL